MTNQEFKKLLFNLGKDIVRGLVSMFFELKECFDRVDGWKNWAKKKEGAESSLFLLGR